MSGMRARVEPWLPELFESGSSVAPLLDHVGAHRARQVARQYRLRRVGRYRGERVGVAERRRRVPESDAHQTQEVIAELVVQPIVNGEHGVRARWSGARGPANQRRSQRTQSLTVEREKRSD